MALRIGSFLFALALLFLWSNPRDVFALSILGPRGIEFAVNRPAVGDDLEVSMSTRQQLSTLHELIDTLHRFPEVHIQVNGFADSGEHSNAGALSERRAKLVYNWLLSHGVRPSQLKGYKGFGSSQPIDDSNNETQRQHNRRVEFQVDE